jgi:hypothetical protein
MSDTNHRRLLDMLAGWEKFVASCADAGIATSPDPTPEEYNAEWESIYDLYQEAGRKSCPTDEWVSDFVYQRVLPLLMNGPASQQPTDGSPEKP